MLYLCGKAEVEPHIPGFAEFEKWREKKVLEIGCGIGTDTVNFARHVARVTSVDLSEKSLELARQRARVCDVQDQVQFYRGNAEELSTFVPIEPGATIEVLKRSSRNGGDRS